MQRYEFTSGSFKFFWEIERNSCSITTNYGRIVGKAQTLIKEFSTHKEARKEYEKRIQEKIEKGYVCVSESEPPKAGASELTNAELERALNLEPNNDRFYLDYGIWQQRNGMIRGDLAMLFHPKPPSQEKLTQFMEKHAAELVGLFGSANHRVADLKETEPLDVKTEYGNSPVFLDWSYGYIRSARLAMDRDQWNEDFWGKGDDTPAVNMLKTYLNMESAKFTRTLSLGCINFEGDNDYGHLLEVLSKTKKLPHLEGLFIGNFSLEDCEISWASVGDVGPLSKNFPKLKTLILRGGNIKLSRLEFPELRRLSMITGGLPKEALTGLKKHNSPKLETLEIYVGTHYYGLTCGLKDFEFLKDAKQFKNLKHLGIKNAVNEEDILKKILSFDILKQLETLDLSMGTLSDREADLILENASKFAHLKWLDLSENFFKNLKKFKDFPCLVHLKEQKADPRYAGDFYVSIGE